MYIEWIQWNWIWKKRQRRRKKNVKTKIEAITKWTINDCKYTILWFSFLLFYFTSIFICYKWLKKKPFKSEEYKYNESFSYIYFDDVFNIVCCILLLFASMIILYSINFVFSSRIPNTMRHFAASNILHYYARHCRKRSSRWQKEDQKQNNAINRIRFNCVWIKQYIICRQNKKK